jgi:hypothetical protein
MLIGLFVHRPLTVVLLGQGRRLFWNSVKFCTLKISTEMPMDSLQIAYRRRSIIDVKSGQVRKHRRTKLLFDCLLSGN